METSEEMRDRLNYTLKQLSKAPRGKGEKSFRSHLNMSLTEWGNYNFWGKDHTEVIEIDECAYAFISFTKTGDKHCTVNHLFIKEEFRARGYFEKLKERILKSMKERGVERLRFFATKYTIKFYERRGFNWHGLSKTGKPFYYGDVNGNLIDLPEKQKKYVAYFSSKIYNPVKKKEL